MTSSKARLIISGALFLAWLSFLFYLVLHTRHPVIARPQFLIAQAVLFVDITGMNDAPKPEVSVREVVWASDPGLKPLAGKLLTIPELIGCGKDQGYEGQGYYAVPLVWSGSAWQIAPIPTPSSYRKPSHASLEIRNAGPVPGRVVEALVAFAAKKPVEATGLLDPILPELRANEFCKAIFGDAFDWRESIVPHGVLPARLPIKDATALQKELKDLGESVDLIKVEVRIYRLTPEVREQVLEAVQLRK
jgi:hypothetical protein